MKGSLAAFDTLDGRQAAALLRDGVLDDFLIDPPEGVIRPGSVFRAKAGRQMKGQGGVMLETPEGRLFLRGAKGIAPGQSLLVQTTTFAEAGKAAPATQKIVFKGRYGLATPGAPGLNISRAIRDEERRADLADLVSSIELPEDMGLIVRSRATEAADEAVLSDISETLALALSVLSERSDGPTECLMEGPGAEETAYREWSAPDSTDAEAGSFARHGVLEMIDGLRRPEIGLESGARLFVEATRALVAVDVNTGADTSPAAGLKTNIAAARALPRALRMRGLGGQIVIDFAPMPKRDRIRVEQQLRAALKSDPIETNFVGWTPLGHAELQRKRERLPLSESLK
ncbi:MAG: ribonuclease E/G [Paracoccaceae bacterium]|nr:ribonuclease E/G [Paracoccaceae bacterium]